MRYQIALCLRGSEVPRTTMEWISWLDEIEKQQNVHNGNMGTRTKKMSHEELLMMIMEMRMRMMDKMAHEWIILLGKEDYVAVPATT